MSTSHQFKILCMKGHMFMKATVLSDNIPAENLGCEWGLSILLNIMGNISFSMPGHPGFF